MAWDETPNLKLPYLLAAQAQKHVTHNEALRALDAVVNIGLLDRDLAAPPASPADGDRYIVAAGATGSWAGHTGHIAAYQDGAWAFYVPTAGWLAWVADESRTLVWNGAAWTDAAAGSLNPTPLVGINATADATNRLAVSAPASLFNHEGAGHQQKINKAGAADTASVLYQTAFSGRAEIGLAGDDDLHIKVSADGATWKEALVVDRASGAVSLPLTPGRECLTANRTYYVSPSGSDTANDGLSAGTPYQTISKAYGVIAGSLDLGGFTVTIQLADGTYTAGLAVSGPWTGGGSVVLQGNAATPGNVVINSAGYFGVVVTAPLPGTLTVQHLRLVCGASGIHHGASGLLRFSNIEFGACGAYHMETNAPGAKIEASGSYTITGNAVIHWLANAQGLIVVAGKTVTLSGTPAFSAAFAYATRLSQIQGYANTFSGTATGTRYLVDGNSLIFTNGAGASAYPGNSAGSVSTGGQYV